MESIQTLLLVVVISLTTLLFVIGWQVLMMILEIRRAIKKLNTMLGESINGTKKIGLFTIIDFFRRKNSGL